MGIVRIAFLGFCGSGPEYSPVGETSHLKRERYLLFCSYYCMFYKGEGKVGETSCCCLCQGKVLQASDSAWEILQGGVGCYLTREYVESLSGSESCFHMEKCDNSAEQQTSVISEL